MKIDSLIDDDFVLISRLNKKYNLFLKNDFDFNKFYDKKNIKHDIKQCLLIYLDFWLNLSIS